MGQYVTHGLQQQLCDVADVCADISLVFSHVAEIQPSLALVLAHVASQLQSCISEIQPDISSLLACLPSSIWRRKQTYVFTDVAAIFTDLSCLLARIACILSCVTGLFARVAQRSIQSNVTTIQSCFARFLTGIASV